MFGPTSRSNWFEAGIGSQVAVSKENRKLEVGLIGREGFCPTCRILGVDRTPHEIIIQIEGQGFKVNTKFLESAIRQSDSLQALMLKFVHAFMLQISFTAHANGNGVIESRLARWLLMCQDRVQSDIIPITHHFISLMLGVRRSGVTTAIHVLEGLKGVRSARGNIQILDRELLKQKAGDSYGVPEAEYERLLGETIAYSSRTHQGTFGIL